MFGSALQNLGIGQTNIFFLFAHDVRVRVSNASLWPMTRVLEDKNAGECHDNQGVGAGNSVVEHHSPAISYKFHAAA